MKRTSRITTQKLTRLALLAAAAVVLGYIEGIITAFAPLPPGIKLGLAKTLTDVNKSINETWATKPPTRNGPLPGTICP